MFVWGCCFGYLFRMGAARVANQPFTASFFIIFLYKFNQILIKKGPWNYLYYTLGFGILGSYIVKKGVSIMGFKGY